MPNIELKGSNKNILDSIIATEAELVKVNAKAINKTAAQFIRESAKETAKAVGVKNKVIRDRTKFKGKQRATPNRQRANVVTLTLQVPVIRLGKSRPKGTGLQVGSGKNARFIDGGFVAPIDKGGKLVFKRVGKKRTPIEHQTIEVSQEFNSIYRRNLERDSGELFQKNWRKEMDKVIKKASR